MKKTVHLICNAHLDPVWLWQWQEGAAEALSTFRTAAELCEENGAFIFNHNEALLYEWIRQFEPALFERIRKLVRAGRWHIMGGWWVQPDCNLPSGESLVRQILAGRQFFKKWFDAEPKTAINFDPFGHSRGMVQILAKSGYTSYLFGRPRRWELELPDDEFVWQGHDGSTVLANRMRGWYHTPLGEARRVLEQRLPELDDKPFGVLLWGVGDHGGGPSRKDVREVDALIAERRDIELRHSTPEAYFEQLAAERERLPVWDKDINPWATGCYTSQIRIKQKHRALENALFSAEKMLTVAALNGLLDYPRGELTDALHDLLLGEFHDILPGSSAPSAEEDSLRLFDHGLEICSRLQTRAFFALAAGQPKAAPDTLPILVFNPHPFPVKTIIECEFQLSDIDEQRVFTEVTLSRGRPVPCQVEQEESNLHVDWRKRVAFAAELAPQQMNRFDCAFRVTDRKPQPAVAAQNNVITVVTDELTVAVNTATGLVDAFRVRGRSIVGAGAFQPLVIEDIVDSWARFEKRFRTVAGLFTLMSPQEAAAFAPLHEPLPPVRVIEDGPVRTVIEAMFRYNHSAVVLHYKIPKIGGELELEVRVFWNEKTKMLKVQIPTIGNRFLGQTAFGVNELPTDGDEAVSQKWCAVLNDAEGWALTCINDGTYGSDFCADGLRLTLLRSPVYAGEELEKMPRDRFRPRIDQGERHFRFRFNMGPTAERLQQIDREALVMNESPYTLAFFPPGAGQLPTPISVLDDGVVQLAALKLAEDGDDPVLRLFNPTNQPQTCTLTLPKWNKAHQLSFRKFEVMTLRVNRDGEIQRVDLLEQQK